MTRMVPSLERAIPCPMSSLLEADGVTTCADPHDDPEYAQTNTTPFELLEPPPAAIVFPSRESATPVPSLEEELYESLVLLFHDVPLYVKTYTAPRLLL